MDDRFDYFGTWVTTEECITALLTMDRERDVRIGVWGAEGYWKHVELLGNTLLLRWLNGVPA